MYTLLSGPSLRVLRTGATVIKPPRELFLALFGNSNSNCKVQVGSSVHSGKVYLTLTSPCGSPLCPSNWSTVAFAVLSLRAFATRNYLITADTLRPTVISNRFPGMLPSVDPLKAVR